MARWQPCDKSLPKTMINKFNNWFVLVLVVACRMVAYLQHQVSMRWYWYVLKSTNYQIHYSDVIMSTVVSQITSITIAYSTIYSGTDQRKHQSSASLAFVRWIPRTKEPVTRNLMFSFDDVIMNKFDIQKLLNMFVKKAIQNQISWKIHIIISTK